MNEHMFFLAQDIFLRRFVASEMKADEIPELACVAIAAAHEFMGVWDKTQTVLEAQTQKAVEAATAQVAKEPPKPETPTPALVKAGFKRPAVKKQKRKAAA